MQRESLVLLLGGFLPIRTSRQSAGWSHNFLSGFSIGAAPNSTSTCSAQEVKSKPLILEKTVYKDNWFNLLSIHHLSNSIDSISGVKRQKRGYDGLIESASVVSRNKSSEEQQELVAKALARAFPMAVISVVRESDFQGNKEKNVVYIPKCRFLETTNCVGMCTNLCKLPSQKFISNSLGMPTNMIPNFEDKSCEIIFGQHPPMDDPALKQPCYRTSCIAKQAHGVNCSS